MKYRGHIVDVTSRRVFGGEVTVENGVISSIVPMDDIEEDAPYFLPGFHVLARDTGAEAYRPRTVRLWQLEFCEDCGKMKNPSCISGDKKVSRASVRIRNHKRKYM